MSEIVNDPFNVNATDLGTNWTEDQHGFGVAASVAEAQSQFGENTAFFTGAAWTGGADGYAEVTVQQLSGASHAGPSFRTAAGNFGYYFVVNDDDAAALGGSVRCGLYLANGGAMALIGATASTTVNVGDVIRIECNGTSIVGKVNGVTVCAVTDATLAGPGDPGIFARWGSGSVTQFSLFAAGDLTGAGPTAAQLSGLWGGMNGSGVIGRVDA
jgi:hypothetical protein